ncbi:hypothetical protein [Oleiphilus sp. HI0079]|nr:hypothetical protein [Oleiphilus sp. HI0079]
MILGLPDTFIDHGRPEVLLAECGLDEKGILSSIEARLSAQKGSLISPVIQSI